MVKKRIQEIWHAGLEDFAARRHKAQSARLSVVREPARRAQALDRETEEQLRRAVVAATAPLRQELEALKEEVAALREQVAGAQRKADGRKH